MPLYTNVFSGWLDYPEYFFIWCYHGKNSILNTMSYKSKELDGFVDGADAHPLDPTLSALSQPDSGDVIAPGIVELEQPTGAMDVQ